METTKINFAKNFTAKVEIADLEKLGWDLDLNYENEEDKKETNEKYHVEITVDDEGKTFWRLLNTQKSNNGINEGSDNEATGDDEQTVEDLKKLQAEGKLWDEENFIAY